MWRSIRFRMTITYLLVIVAVMFATGIILLNMLEQYYLSSEEENLERTGKLAAQFIFTYLRDGADSVLLSSVAENFSRQLNARVIIVNPQYTVLGDSLRVGGYLGSRLERPEIKEALEGGIGRNIQYSTLSSQWVLQLAVPVEREGLLQGAVFFSTSLEPVHKTLADVRRLLFYSTIVAMLLAGTLVVLFAHHLTGPIKDLTVAAQQMAEGNLDQKIAVSSKDEIGRLAEQFNIMAARVKDMNQRLTRFVADVSHDLRTPLASIHICLESLLNYEMKPEEQREFLQDINQETKRLIYMVEDLLDLTRRQEVADKREIISLGLLLEEVIDVTRPRLERKEQQFFTHIPTNLPFLNVSPEALKRVLFNLLDNSIKFTPSGGWIKLSAEWKDNEVAVTIEDTGCGIPQDCLPFIFERFYRVDKSRSRYLGGTGLGLAICKEIVEHYGGKICVQSQEGKGSIFCFSLPVDASIQPQSPEPAEFMGL
ncbi:MAG: cell wall metabolism sensor histidine kinase WalK [Firmicutes bacterium]|nr:cell wall metabolism sensor histidine kinase WalK [Bacillota bacterium]